MKIQFLLASLVMSGIVSCKGDKSSDTKRNIVADGGDDAVDEADGPDGPDGPDGADAGVDEVSVPMQLWNADAFTRAIEVMPPTLSGVIPADDPDTAPEKTNFTTPAFNYVLQSSSYALAVHNAPATIMASFRSVMQNLRWHMKSRFGAQGLYAGQDIKFTPVDGKASVTYAAYDPTVAKELQPEYHVVAYDKDAAYPFSIEVWTRTAANADDFALTHRWQFRQKEGGEFLELNVATTLPVGARAGSEEGTRFVEIEHSDAQSGTGTVTMRAGLDTSTVARAKNMVVQYGYDDSVAYAQGAYSVGGTLATAMTFDPRYRVTQRGDLHFFRTLGSLAEGGQGIMDVAFMAKEDQPVPFTVDSSIFSANGFLPSGLNSLAAMIRDPSIFAGCSTAGTDFKAQMQADSVTVPTSLDGAPASFCEGSLSADAVNGIIYDMCHPSNSSYSLHITVDAGSTTESVDICSELYHASFFSNPLRIKIAGSDERVSAVCCQISTPTSLTAFLSNGADGAEQQGFYETLKAKTFPDVSDVLTTTWEEAAHRTAGEFTVAGELGDKK